MGAAAAVSAAPGDETGPAFSLLPKSLQKNPVLDLTVITEVTEEGKKVPVVSPAAPAYYVLHSAGFRQLGDPMAGESTVQEADMERLLTRALATNGYRATPPEQRPTLFIIYTWGSHNLTSHVDWSEIDPITTVGQTYPPRGAESAGQIQRNLLDRAALVGGDKFAQELRVMLRQADDMAMTAPAELFLMVNPIKLFKDRDPKNARLLEHAAEELYYVVASAYDYAAVARNERRLLWRTRMTVSSDGVSQPQTLGPLIATAAPFFGKEMTGPEFIHKRVLDGKVEIGVPSVVDPKTK